MCDTPPLFYTEQGDLLDAPLEWSPCLLVLATALDDTTVVTLQGKRLELQKRRIQGTWRLVASLPRLGVGGYHLGLNGQIYVFTVQSSKLNPNEIEQLLIDLHYHLPASIALSLQRANVLVGGKVIEATQLTITSEINRLRNAIKGTSAYRGLCDLLPALQHAPHQHICTENQWQTAQSARRPHPAQLIYALQAHNLDAQQSIKRVLDQRSELTVDVYENQLVKTYLHQVRQALCRLRGIARCRVEVDALWQALLYAEHQAPFLQSVRLLTHLPQRETTVFQHVPLYQAVMLNYKLFQENISINLYNKSLELPLENLPVLYQLWGTLQILQALLTVGESEGYQVIKQALCVPDKLGWLVNILPNGKPALVLQHPIHHTTVSFIPERTYQQLGAGFQQRPDIAIEIENSVGELQVYLFDPKYKLDSHQDKPQKVDIDKMHAYRDAIRQRGKHVVRYAAILYPATTQQFTAEIAAFMAIPSQAEALQTQVQTCLRQALKIPLIADNNHNV
ncbi:DUF2357 domain-containing protein [Beggiatoa leptomitoformis]|uniref:DUF2357 domain-containing protein n=1 Tax=Beggiatoa leptomitoformis TaxID=288004 RepID=A0A2N9YG07_9GAMM|nr:DUF2357 domain-containing protein [Beggiatoa leptomitoformis]ALG68195.1 DUF2357 domain-containing protein [Beggiatoa leptomitoformis]AUI69501.1 DUF2357 domain-containing protein [Beggiatoa leptomitoformis]